MPRSRNISPKISFTEDLYNATLGNPNRLFSIVFIVLSIIVWYSILTIFLKNLIQTNFGLDSSDVFERMTTTPTDTILIGIPAWILFRVQDKTILFVTTIFGYFNSLMYILNPQELFKWLGNKAANYDQR